MNRQRGAGRLNLFYVKQAGRLQCLNGAYLSDLDEELLTALFGESSELKNVGDGLGLNLSVETGVQLATVRARIGQARFARAVKAMYAHHCCFPDCPVDDDRFLVASHIAR